MPLIDERKVYEEFERKVWSSMIAKKWYTSKTMITNIVVIIGMVVNAIWGIQLDGELQTALAVVILAGINIYIRIKTTQPIGK